MSTFMANPQNIERKWYLVDAEGKTMGRLAADVATLLNGKHKVTYTPHQDCGDFVIVTNVEKMVLPARSLTRSSIAHTRASRAVLRKLSTTDLWLQSLSSHFVSQFAVCFPRTQ